MSQRLRLLIGAVGVLAIAVAASALLFPGLFGVVGSPKTAALQQLPQPAQIISAQNFPSPLPFGGNPIPREPPGAIDGWRISLPQLNIDLPLIQGDGLNVPYYKAAHYPTTAWPGDGGRSFIYAHAQYGPPIMFGPLLAQGRTGLDVYVTRPQQPRLHYVIQQYYAAWPISDLRWLQPTDHEELILMTCTSWNAADPRVIAVAEPAP